MRRSSPIFIVVLAVLSMGTATQATASEDPEPFRLYADVGVQGFSGGIGSVSQLTGRYRFARHWYMDIVGRSGTVFAGSASADQFYFAMGVGPGFSTGEELDGWEFRASPRVTHVHHASFDSWGETPWSNLAGDSNGGVRHRSGAELAVGVSGPQFGRIGDLRFLWSADVMAGVLPSSEEMKFGAGALLGLSLRGW
jgi:hypothetical protein